MGPAELKAATDLACEINKSLGLDENFGVGAKVSSLANNKLGMRFRSCKAGRVCTSIDRRSKLRSTVRRATQRRGREGLQCKDQHRPALKKAISGLGNGDVLIVTNSTD